MEKEQIIKDNVDTSQLVGGRGIYAIINTVNKRVYVGQSKDINGRIRQHIRTLKNETHKNIRLQRAFNKYGAKSFKAVTLEISNEENLYERENYWATQYDSFRSGYNIAKIEKKDIVFERTDEQIARYKSCKLTRENVVEICHLLNKQVPAPEIGKMFGVSPGTIHGIKQRRNWVKVSKNILTPDKLAKCQKLSKEDVVEICKLINQQVSMIVIAERFGVTKSTISLIRQRKTYTEITEKLYIEDSPHWSQKKLQKDDVIKICKLLNEQVPISVIKDMFGVDKSSIEKIRDGRNWKTVSQSLIIPENILKNSRLNEEEVTEICKLIIKKIPNKEIADKYGVSVSLVVQIKKMKIWKSITVPLLKESSIESKKCLTKKEVEEICRLLNKQVSLKEISKKYDVHPTHVSFIKRGKAWVDVSKSILCTKKLAQRKRLTEDTVIDICRMLNEKISPYKIAEKYDVSPSLIYNIRNKKIWIKVSANILNIEA